jgi:hypothetical protein
VLLEESPDSWRDAIATLPLAMGNDETAKVFSSPPR